MITFDKENHEYRLNGKRLKSVSEWLEQFIPPFNALIIAEACAKKENTTAGKILEKWDLKKQISLDLGNYVHGSIEYYLKHDKDFTNEPIEAFKKLQENNTYHSEVIVHDDEVAGTIDLIEVVEKGKVKIHDFKTGNDLHKKNGKMLGEYKKLDNTPYNRYSLQLKKYKELLEKMKNVEVVEMNIWHYQDNKFEIIKI